MRYACILLAVAVSAGAQSIAESEAARAKRLLASPQWMEKAWGAYYAGTLRSDELKDSLVEAFREATALRDADADTEPYGYLAALFDAAIQSNLKVPPEVLEPFEEKWAAPVIILLGHDNDSEECLLRMREQQLSGGEWLAVNNLLFGLKSAQFLVRTLSELSISHVFTVTDPEFRIIGVTGSGHASVCGDGFASRPKGFPPIGMYVLKPLGQQGDVLVSPSGPEIAYYHRLVVLTDKQSGFGACGGDDREREWLRLRYLALLENLAEPPMEKLFHAQTTILYQNQKFARQQWDAALTAQESGIRAFFKRTQDNGMPSVTGMTLKIVVQLNDRRQTTTGPVPTPATRELVLE
jgi:hypothetical protein